MCEHICNVRLIKRLLKRHGSTYIRNLALQFDIQENNKTESLHGKVNYAHPKIESMR